MPSIAIVGPTVMERVSGVAEIRVRVTGGAPDERVKVIIGPPEYGTRAATPAGGDDHVYRWDTRRKLVDPSLPVAGDAVYWITASAVVAGVQVETGPVPVVTANSRAPLGAPAAGGADRGGGWRPELRWAADYSDAQRWRSSHNAVIGSAYAKLVDDPVLGRRRRVVRVSVPDSAALDDDQPNNRTVRFQSSSRRRIQEGDEFCVGFSYLLPDDFPTVYPKRDPLNPKGPGGSGYISLFQFYGPPYTQGAPFVLHAERRLVTDPLDEVCVRGNELNPGDPVPLLSLPYRRGRWTDVVFRMRVSSSIEDGWVEVYANQGESGGVRPITSWRGQRRIPRVLLRPDSGLFRTDMQLYRVRGVFGRVTVYHSSHRIAETVQEADPGTYRTT